MMDFEAIVREARATGEKARQCNSNTCLRAPNNPTYC